MAHSEVTVLSPRLGVHMISSLTYATARTQSSPTEVYYIP